MPRQPSHELAGCNRALVADAGLGLEHEAAIVLGGPGGQRDLGPNLDQRAWAGVLR